MVACGGTEIAKVLGMRFSALFLIFFFYSSTFAILNGSDAKNNYPSVINYSVNEKGDICTATILSSKVLLSASHCLIGNKNISNIFIKGEKRAVDIISSPNTNWSMHLNAYRRDVQSDIVLIVLRQESFELSRYPAITDLESNLHFNTQNSNQLIVVGAGPNSKKSINPRSLTRNFHNFGVRSMNAQITKTISDRSFNMKSVDPNISICRGDSGAPVFHQDTIIGIVSARSDIDQITQEVKGMSSDEYCKQGDFVFYVLDIKPYLDAIKNVIYAVENKLDYKHLKLTESL
jgi:V8-like Glu-specific endopeptidase